MSRKSCAWAGSLAQAIRDILYTARTMAGLAPAEVAALIQVTDRALRAEIMQAAREVHERAYGRRLGIFAPVCPTNNCVKTAPTAHSAARIHYCAARR